MLDNLVDLPVNIFCETIYNQLEVIQLVNSNRILAAALCIFMSKVTHAGSVALISVVNAEEHPTYEAGTSFAANTGAKTATISASAFLRSNNAGRLNLARSISVPVIYWRFLWTPSYSGEERPEYVTVRFKKTHYREAYTLGNGVGLAMAGIPGAGNPYFYQEGSASVLDLPDPQGNPGIGIAHFARSGWNQGWYSPITRISADIAPGPSYTVITYTDVPVPFHEENGQWIGLHQTTMAITISLLAEATLGANVYTVTGPPLVDASANVRVTDEYLGVAP